METRVIRRLKDVDPVAWDRLVGNDDPFVEHGFLAALEQSGSVGPGTGWVPRHVGALENGELVGALPLYLKDDSWGEFVFDFQWAGAAQRAGIVYYPKLTSMVPFTPATGKRVLIADDTPADKRKAITGELLNRARELMLAEHASSLHVMYLTPEERALLIEVGAMRPRLAMQYHWRNEGWSSFDDYLAAFRSPARKQVRKERREVAESGIDVRVKEGPELTEQDWRALVTFYRVNCARHGSYPYLTPRFFDQIRSSHAHRLVACLAYRDGEPIAASINFEKGSHLYGRYWGCVEQSEFLHFEVCYYRLIERAIVKGHRRFEAGAQGEHKLKRGLLPSPIHSVHWIAHPGLASAIDDYLPHEAMAVERNIEEQTQHGPFKREHVDG